MLIICPRCQEKVHTVYKETRTRDIQPYTHVCWDCLAKPVE